MRYDQTKVGGQSLERYEIMMRMSTDAEGNIELQRGETMARYGRTAQKTVRSAMRRRKRGTLKSAKAGKGGRVKNRKQAIAIGLSEARKKGAKVPRKKSS